MPESVTKAVPGTKVLTGQLREKPAVYGFESTWLFLLRVWRSRAREILTESGSVVLIVITSDSLAFCSQHTFWQEYIYFYPVHFILFSSVSVLKN
jgi:hypothetical protein